MFSISTRISTIFARSSAPSSTWTALTGSFFRSRIRTCSTALEGCSLDFCLGFRFVFDFGLRRFIGYKF